MIKKSGTQIPKFSSRKNPSKIELIEFRNYVSQLKKRGLISSKIDARVARPARISGGKTLAEIVNKNRDDLKHFTPAAAKKQTKKIVAKKVSDKNVAKIKATEKRALKGQQKELPKLKRGQTSLISIRDLPIGKNRSLATVMRDMEQNPEKYDALKRPGERWAFQIKGSDSLRTFPDVQLMISETFKYGNGNGPYKRRDVFHDDYRSRSLFDSFKLIKWKGDALLWEKTRVAPAGKKRKKKKGK